MPGSARVDGATVLFLLAAIAALLAVTALTRRSDADTVVRDSEGNAIDPAALESDEPPEVAEQAALRERTRRWSALTRGTRWFGGLSMWWWWRR